MARPAVAGTKPITTVGTTQAIVKNARNGLRTPAASETAPRTGETIALSSIASPTVRPSARLASPSDRPSVRYRERTQIGST
jgi:hypothetical protein